MSALFLRSLTDGSRLRNETKMLRFSPVTFDRGKIGMTA
jgi:hypothetical protein